MAELTTLDKKSIKYTSVFLKTPPMINSASCFLQVSNLMSCSYVTKSDNGAAGKSVYIVDYFNQN